jgi:hypothetical protein
MSLDDLRARDEVLQVMYWMLGENIAHEVDAGYLARFLALSASDVSRALETLARERLAFRGGRAGAFRLSEEGIREGGRRFHDEFRDLTRQPHGECAPGCVCHKPEGEGKPCPTRSALTHA